MENVFSPLNSSEPSEYELVKIIGFKEKGETIKNIPIKNTLFSEIENEESAKLSGSDYIDIENGK